MVNLLSAGVLLCLGYIAAVLAVGVPLLGPMRTPLSAVLWYTLCAAVMTCALAALFAMIAQEEPNPSYVRGIKRTVYQFLYDLPGCQTVQPASAIEPGAPPRLPLCSLAVIVLSAGAGISLFRKKDLK